VANSKSDEVLLSLANKLREYSVVAGKFYSGARANGNADDMQEIAIQTLGQFADFLSKTLPPEFALEAAFMVEDIGMAIGNASVWRTRSSDNSPHQLLDATGMMTKRYDIKGELNRSNIKMHLWGGLAAALVHQDDEAASLGMEQKAVAELLATNAGVSASSIIRWKGEACRNGVGRRWRDDIVADGKSVCFDNRNPPRLDGEFVKKWVAETQKQIAKAE
jgi:hypothetical protein